MKGQVSRAVETARQTEAAQEVHDGLAKGLRDLNEELRRLIEHLQKGPDQAAGESSASVPSPEEATPKSE